MCVCSTVYIPWITKLTEVVLWEVLCVDLHTLNVLPHATTITADHVAIVMLKLTDTASHIVTIVLKDRLRVTCIKGGRGERGRESV